MEEAIGITCGNLALLQPLFRHFFSNKESRISNGGINPPSYSFTATIKSNSNNGTSTKNILPSSRLASKSGRTPGLYTRMSEDIASSDRTRRRSIIESESEIEAEDIEMQDRDIDYSKRILVDDQDDKGFKGREGIVILVKTDVTVEKERNRDDERCRLKRDLIVPLREPPAKVSCRTDNVWNPVEESGADFRVVRERLNSYSEGK